MSWSYLARTIPNGSILYIDTNILVDYLLLPTNHKDYKICKSLFTDILIGNLKGNVSTWTIAETVDVIKRIIVDKGGNPPTSSDIQTIKKNILNSLSKLNIDIIDTDNLIQQGKSTQLFERVNDLVINSGVRPTKYKSKSLGVADCVHEWIAENSGMTHIISKDKSYKNIQCQTTNCLLWEEY